jgi:hypothetical protein
MEAVYSSETPERTLLSLFLYGDSSPCPRSEGVWDSGGIAPLVLNLGTTCCSGSFIRGTEPPFRPPRIETRFLGCPTCSLVTMLTELSWLSKK